jgi:uncharacterized protein
MAGVDCLPAIKSVLCQSSPIVCLQESILLFVFTLLDKPEQAELRFRMRPAHKAYLAAVADQIAFAGPLTHDDGKTMLGSLLVIDFPTRDAAHSWLAKEPFTQAGLYGSISVHAFVNLWPQKTGFPPPVNP